MNIGEIIKIADKTVTLCNSRDPYLIADFLGIEIIERDFKLQKGAYKIILNNDFIFVKKDLDYVTKNVVISHEIGHSQLHRREAVTIGGFREYNLFSKQDVKMEKEANIFTAQLLLADSEFLEYAGYGYDIKQIASAMNTDVNLACIKAELLSEKYENIKTLEYKSNFLKD